MSHQGTGMARLDDVAEREEWTDAINSVIAFEGTGVADDILTEVVATARRSGAKIPFAAHTAYINTILPERQPDHPGDRDIERRIRALPDQIHVQAFDAS